VDDLLREFLREVTGAPARFAAELLQSVILLAIIWWAGRRWLGRRLAERQAEIATAVAEAAAAEREYPRIQEEARAVAAGVEPEKAAIARAAAERAEQERRAALDRLEAEARQVVTQARQTIESEKRRVLREASDRLAILTTETARRYLDEMLSASELHGLTQKAILESLQEMERGAPPPGTGVP